MNLSEISSKYSELHEKKIVYVDDCVDNFQWIVQTLDSAKIVGIDTETTGLDPYTSELRLVQVSTKTYRFVFDLFGIKDESILNYLRELLLDPDRIKVFHNAKFDLKFLKLHLRVSGLGKIYCTMLGSKLLACGNMTTRHNLKAVLERYLSIEVDKAEQKSDWSSPILTSSQIEYAATDSMHLIDLREVQVALLKQYKMRGTAKIEMEALEAVVDMELNGMPFNWEKWSTRADQQKKKAKELEYKIKEMLADGVPQLTLFGVPEWNVNSDKQLKERMKAVGIKLPTKRSSRDSEVEKETVDVLKLEEIKEQHEVIPVIVEQAILNKAWTTYGRNWSKYVNSVTKRIHVSYSQIGAMTGRFTTAESKESDDPPMLGIPREDQYRSAFEARSGYVMVWGDYSIIELRILAELSNDRRMIQAFRDGIDLHQDTASSIFDEKFEKVSKDKRRLAKDLNYGKVYGIGALRFSKKAKITLAQAYQVMDAHDRTYPQLKEWLFKAAANARNLKYCRTMSGRLVRFHFDETQSWAVALAERNGKNTPVQGTSADMLKVALKLVHDKLKGTGILMCHCVHDEVILESPISLVDQAKEILESSMVAAGEVFLKKVPVKIDVQSGPHWKK